MQPRVYLNGCHIADYGVPLPVPLGPRLLIYCPACPGRPVEAQVRCRDGRVELLFTDERALRLAMAWAQERDIPMFIQTPCLFCGEMSAPSNTDHLPICPGAPPWLRALAKASVDLAALASEPAGTPRTLAAAQHLGRCVAEADFEKNPVVSEAGVLDDVEAFFRGRPWFRDATREAALERLRALRPCKFCGGPLAEKRAADHLRGECPLVPASVKRLAVASHALDEAIDAGQIVADLADEVGYAAADDFCERPQDPAFVEAADQAGLTAEQRLGFWVAYNFKHLPAPVLALVQAAALARHHQRLQRPS